MLSDLAQFQYVQNDKRLSYGHFSAANGHLSG